MSKRKGIILAGGSGTRLFPVTKVISKQLLPIYDKPMIYYPLSTLMLAGIRQILIISTPQCIDQYSNLLGDGQQFGIEISYKIQKSPDGIAQAFLIAEDFLKDSPCALILGDNIFYGASLKESLLKISNKDGATIFGYSVSDPSRYGIVSFKNENVVDIVEKPVTPKSNYAVTGLYFYDNNVVNYAKELMPSNRNELEITDLNNIYLNEGNLRVKLLGSGYAWLDAGTTESMLEAASYISTIQKRQGILISSPEEVAFENSWIDKSELDKLIFSYPNNKYKDYLSQLLTSDD